MRDRGRVRVAGLIGALVVARLLMPLLLIHPIWEFHRDELLYFAMGDHLDFLRMQFPPFIAVVARASATAFGDSVLAARVPAALGGAGLLAVMLFFARRLGAGAASLILIAMASVAAPVFLRPSVLFQPVVFDQLWCVAAVTAIALAVAEEEPRWWLAAGLGLGLGAMTKFSVAFYVICIAVTVLILPAPRRQLRTRWPWIAAAVAALLAVPSLFGQWMNGWPFPAQMAELNASQLGHVSAGQFLSEQPLMLGSASLLVVVAVLAGGRRWPERVPLVFGALLVALMLVLDGKAYYAAPAYPLLVVTGALGLERRVRSTGRRWPLWATYTFVGTGGLLLLPMGIPLLGPQAMAQYAQRLGVTTAVRTNRGETLPLPQDYADMLGWRAQAESVSAVYDSLSEVDRTRAVIVARNYGEAGALAMYRRRYGYPYPVAVTGDFHAWGPGSRSGEVGVVLGQPVDESRLREIWVDVGVVRRLGDPRGVPEEQDLCIFVVRGLRRPLPEVWPELGPVWG